MSVVPVKVPARRRSVFDDDFDVMSGYRLSYSGEFPAVPFGATVWDFSSVPDIPKDLARSYLLTDWNRVDSRWGLLVRELLAAMLCPLHPAVVALPRRRRWPLPFVSLRGTVSQVSHWLEWLDGAGIGSLDAVTQQSCDGYLLQFDHRSPGYRMNRVIAVRSLRDYAPVLSAGYRDGFMPWGRRSSSEVAGFTTGANKTPPIPDQALHAMLTGALFLLGRPAEDVIAATAEVRALPRSKRAPFSVERFSEGVAKLARDHVARGVPLRAPPTRVRTRSARSTSVCWLAAPVSSRCRPTRSSPRRATRSLRPWTVSESRTAGCWPPRRSSTRRPGGGCGPISLMVATTFTC